MSDLLKKINDEFRKTGYRNLSLRSVAWYRDRLRKISVNRKQLLLDSRVQQKNTPIWGKMYMYFYDPKTKDKLPYWDKFPLTIIIEPDRNGTGFYGLNLHYLPYELRAAFLSDLVMDESKTKNLDNRNKFILTYRKLKAAAQLKEFKACFKHYLYDHLETPLSEVKPEDWEAVIFLPAAYFTPVKSTKVWSDSLKHIKGIKP